MNRPAGAGRAPLVAIGFAFAFVCAAVVAAAGLGLGVPHLRKEGVGVAGVLGVAALVAGLALAAYSAWWLLARLRRRWWPLAVPLLLVATYLAFWTVGQGFTAGLPPRPALGDRTPADLGLAYEDVRLPTADGVDLAGWWVPSENGGAVVLLHGAGSTRTAVLDEAGVLADAGWGVLLLDARGHGESEGSGMDFGWWGESDVAAALDFVAAQAGVSAERIGLLGLSMGGEEAIGAAGADDRVRAVVAEGATNRVAADKEYLVDEHGARGSLQVAIDRLTYAVAGLLSDAPRPRPLRDSLVDAAERGVRFLLLTAGEVPEEGWAADRLERAAPSAVEVWTVEGADHVGGLDRAPEKWAARVLGFLDEVLPTRR
ncbi:alpha/beta hydrolase [Nocardioides ferulae]|uniref:alpha/beta hydrolase n=1 Tax=Nocardioides ferulae TaxID=2340821 RepID=UPI0013DE5BB0|nr:alpha/beta fold hydrolase [Nocardioides ferulae]